MTDTINRMTDSFFDAIDDSTAPIYARVKKAIAHKVLIGEWQEKQRVPSEAEMVKALGVSRMTVNRALRELTAEGVLVRQQGVGTFVAEKKAHSALFEVHNIADEIESRGHRHSARLIHLERARATSDEAMNLGVRISHRVFRSTVLHFENQVPMQLEERVVNAALAPAYDEQDFTRHTAHEYLMQVAIMTEGEHLVEAVLPTEYECELLQISATEPCLQIKRRTWSGENLVATARLLHAGSRFQLFGHFGR
ncbi:MAG: histidine utilization repressor [Gammaproteobacteria bacterium]|nr:histidine utilization repressor [Gammaproteobacteria bacterium]